MWSSGHVPTQILRGRAWRSGCKGPGRQRREGASRKWGVRCLLSLSLSRFRPPSDSVESEVGWAFQFTGSSCVGRVSDCERRSATSRVSSVRSTRRRKPRGLWGKDGRLSICLSLEAKRWCRRSGWLVLHSRSLFPSSVDQERHCPVSGAASPPQIAARLWDRAHRARGATRRSWCGQSRGNPPKRATKLQDPGQV